MPLFHFDLHTPTEVVSDVDGVDVVDAASALRGCISGIEEGLLEGVDCVVVRNEQGVEIAWIKVDAVQTRQSSSASYDRPSRV